MNIILRQGLPPLPAHMRKLPIDHRGFPVPHFASMVDGEWDFVHVAPGKIREAYQKGICWLCGERLFKNKAFCIGPMCAVTRISAEPPSHCECAKFAVAACPFLSRPKMRRLPKSDDDRPTAGIMIDRNPGVTIIWTCRNFSGVRTEHEGNVGILFKLGDPIRIEAYAEGRDATIAEVRESFDTGVPLLRAQAEKDEHAEGRPGAVAQLERMTAKARKLLRL